MCVRCFILLFFAYFKVIADCFYILDVGQGNCQLAIFEKEKIGVLYDCGSSSTKKPRKLISKGSPEPDKQIYEVKKHVERKDSTSSVDVSKLIDEDDQVDEEKSSENSQSMSASQQSNVSVGIGNYLKDLTHLFVILSHPDKDHVNCISEGNIPGSLFITVLCEGDWFGQKNASGTGLRIFMNF